MSFFTLIFTLILFLTTQSFAEGEKEQYLAEVQKIWDGLKPQRGEIKLLNGVATLTVPDEFFYLSPSDSETVLTKIWGNPPTGENNLGMLFPTGATAVSSGTWGVTINYEEDGYVSDENADDIDYDDLLSDMQESVDASNKQRAEMGYETIQLVGWASKPYYDSLSHKLHWAQEIQFGDQTTNTLNYNIRVLGRKGVLLLNFIAEMDQLYVINSQVDTVLNIAEFNDGLRYADFNPDIDTVAAYGIGALIAGKVAAKVGLLATILLLFKKFWFILILAVGGFFKRLFR